MSRATQSTMTTMGKNREAGGYARIIFLSLFLAGCATNPQDCTSYARGGKLYVSCPWDVSEEETMKRVAKDMAALRALMDEAIARQAEIERLAREPQP
jgi:hypothetical protein